MHTGSVYLNETDKGLKKIIAFVSSKALKFEARVKTEFHTGIVKLLV